MNLLAQETIGTQPTARPKSIGMSDLIFVSLEDWDDIWRRNQFICSTLARRFPDRKILFVGLPRNLPQQWLKVKTGRSNSPVTWTIKETPNITVTKPPKLFPDAVAAGRVLNGLLTRSHVTRISRSLGIKNPLLWLNPYSAGHMVNKLNVSHVIYDITDDWPLVTAFSRSERERIKAQDRELCKRADLVIVCSEALRDSRRHLCKRLLLLPNGVDVEHYAEARGERKSSSWPAPVFGYTGTLHPDRTDIKLVIDLARAFPGGSVVLVGPDHLTPPDRKLLALEPNVFVEGPLPYTALPQSMSQFDVCIVPHVETEFTESLNPIKLWEYLACGKPIVSTNIAGFRSYPHLCRIATDAVSFVRECKAALLENAGRRAERITEARKHTWETRVDALLEALVEHRLIAA